MSAATPETPGSRGSWIKRLLLLLVLLGVTFGGYAYYRLMYEHREPLIEDPDERFKYGSIGAEHDAGLPYWIFYVLPRVFPEYLPGPGGGYASFGVPWEQGQELPIGFTKRVIGIPRVANNCAVCHTASYRTDRDSNPVFVPGGPAHTTNVAGFFRFFILCAKDPRFNADNLMREIQLVTELDWFDRFAYRFLIIPITKKRLLEREKQFAWVFRPDLPDWGRGRDDAMNLTKYFMIRAEIDDTFGPTDMPAVWNLQKYRWERGMRMNLAGDSHDAYSVIIDSALGLLGAAPRHRDEFLGHVNWLHEYLKARAAPRYPFPIDAVLAGEGRGVFERNCATCHASERTGMRIPLVEVGTDRDRLDTWSKDAAVASNRVVRAMGIDRKGLVEEPLVGYVAPFLDGIWLRAPYLHNGSVPTLADVLEPQARRPKSFYRGYDVYDPERVGFVTAGPEAEHQGTRHEVGARGGGNQGHEFGTELPPAQKKALVEYLKTL